MIGIRTDSQVVGLVIVEGHHERSLDSGRTWFGARALPAQVMEAEEPPPKTEEHGVGDSTISPLRLGCLTCVLVVVVSSAFNYFTVFTAFLAES